MNSTFCFFVALASSVLVANAVAQEPKTASDFYARALEWQSKQEHAKAVADFSEAIKLDPKEKYYYLLRSLSLEEIKEFDKAQGDLDQVAKLDPASTDLRQRGRLWLAKKDYEKAIDNYTKSFEESSKKVVRSGKRLFLTPDQQALIPIDCEQLAWIYSSCPDDKFRDGKKAVEWAKKSFEYAGPKVYWRRHEALAAAHAEAGDFDKAVDEQLKAANMLKEKIKNEKNEKESAKLATASKEAVERYNLYRDKKPYRLAGK